MKRLDCLDGLRGLLALYVLLGHMLPFAAVPAWMLHAFFHGGAAVDLFFALSGLVITDSLDRMGGRAGSFLLMRVMRIYPVYLPVLALAIASQPLSCGFGLMPWLPADSAARMICVSGWPKTWSAEIAAHMTMTHGIFPDSILPDAWVSFLGSAWSLSAEWQFYLLVLIVRDRRRLVWLLLGLAAAASVWRLAGPEAWQFSRAFLPNQAHYFALGVASLDTVRRQRTNVVPLGVLPLGMIPLAVVVAIVLGICGTFGSMGKMVPPLAWLLCLGSQTLPRHLVLRPVRWLLSSRTCLHLGTISYSLYLVNEPVHKLLCFLLSRMTGGNAGLFTLLWLPLAGGIPVALSFGLHRWIEAPALAWGRSLRAASGSPFGSSIHPSPGQSLG